MDFSIGEDRQMLVESFSRFLADKSDFTARQAAVKSDEGFDRALWEELAELGVLGALFSEEAGGFGGCALDIGVVFAEIGRAIATGPFLATLMAGKVLEAAGEADLLADLISGAKIVTFADACAVKADGSEAAPVKAVKSGDGYALTGAKGVVDYLSAADHTVVTAEVDGGRAAFFVDLSAEGVAKRSYPIFDGGSAGELDLANAPAKLLGGEASIAKATAFGHVAVVWESLGVMEVLRDSTLEYLRTRKQFGVPIGKFQVLQHRMATVALEIEQARSAAINSVVNFDKNEMSRDRFCSAGKFTAAKVGRIVAEEAIQMHGGIGMTWELPLSHFAKRLISLNQTLGDEDEHLVRFAQIKS